MSAPNSYTIDLLERVSEFLDDYSDIRDGSDGPLPNAAMSLQLELEQHITTLKRQDATGEGS